MENIFNFVKELLLIKKEDKKIIGLTSFRTQRKRMVKKAVKKVQKELNLSDLMRRHKISSKTQV